VTRVQWPVPIDKNSYLLSYRIIETGGKTTHTIKSLAEAIRIAGEGVRNVVWTGWSMFHQFSRPAIAPRVVLDVTNGEEVEALETNLLGETQLEATIPDVWRITTDGRASVWRPYREDRARVPHLAAQGLTPGRFLAPRVLIRELYELVTHAKELSKAFPHASSVEFRCTWSGLKNRKIADFEPGVHWHDYTCHVDERTSTTTAPVDIVTADSASVVAALAAPVLNLFDGFELSRDWIVKEVPKFRML
jgi:hypothetical protein